MTEIPVPAGIVESEFDARQHDAVHSFDHDEAAFDAYLAGRGPDPGRVRRGDPDRRRGGRPHPAAAGRAGRGSRASGSPRRSSPTGIIYNAQRFGVSPDEYFQRMQEGNQLGA